MVSKSLGGWAVNIHDAESSAMPLLGEAFISTSLRDAAPDAVSGVAGATGAGSTAGSTGNVSAGVAESAKKGVNANRLPEVDADAQRWNPDSGQSVADRLREIVGEAMGYDVEDLPGELPLIDLGLDSLMGMRIKNRVEYDFDIPPLQVQALRDGSVDDVIAIVEQMVNERHSAGAGAATEAELEGVRHAAAAESAETTESSTSPDASEKTTDYTATAVSYTHLTLPTNREV